MKELEAQKLVKSWSKHTELTVTNYSKVKVEKIEVYGAKRTTHITIKFIYDGVEHQITQKNTAPNGLKFEYILK